MSEAAEAWIRLDGKRFSLRDWPMHVEFYDGRYDRVLFKTSRQVAKSTTLSNFSIIECSLIPHFSTMFVSPTKEQTTRFSATRVGKTLRYSPIISHTFLKTDLTDRVFHKQFSNGSEMLFTYGSDDAERLRGPSTHRNMYDEVQDILYDPVITVGNETMANSNYQYETYAGTPKTMENTIQYLWEISTQTEWIMKCGSCSKYQYIDTEKAVGKDGPICVSCGAYLNPREGQWVDLNTEIKNDDYEGKLKGFHLSQLIMPFNSPLAMRHRGNEAEELARKRWKGILRKYEGPISVFRNEVLGVSDAIGTRMITKEELESLCEPYPLLETPNQGHLKDVTITVGGVDWSGGGTTGVSRTVLWIWGFKPGNQKLKTLFYKVYPGINPVHIIKEIALICSHYRVALVIGDAGEGFTSNNELRTLLGEHRVHQVQYGTQSQALKWNGQDRYLADRTTLIDNYFMFLKRKAVEFAQVEEMGTAITDILNEYEEITSLGRKVWRHSPQKPDDCLHAGLFGWIAFKIVQNDIKFYQ